MNNNYPAQSDIWRLNLVNTARKTTGKITQLGKSRVLYRAKQVFPINFFPSEIIVEELRIIHLKQMGPWASDIFSIMATDIASVEAANGLLFGHISIKSLTGGPEIFVESLTKRDVYNLRSLVEGIALSAREGLKINSQNLETEMQSLYRAGDIN